VPVDEGQSDTYASQTHQTKCLFAYYIDETQDMWTHAYCSDGLENAQAVLLFSVHTVLKDFQ
jgi:hypothetical protein